MRLRHERPKHSILARIFRVVGKAKYDRVYDCAWNVQEQMDAIEKACPYRCGASIATIATDYIDDLKKRIEDGDAEIKSMEAALRIKE